MNTRGVLENVFDEKRVKILKAFINSPEEDFYLREVGRAAGVAPATTFRIVNQLNQQGFLKVTSIKKTKFYRLADNKKTQALRDIFEEKKTAIDEFVDFVSNLEGVERIILHGKESKDKTNILVIGEDLRVSSIKEKVGSIKAKYNISIIELTLSSEQFQQMSVMGLFPGVKKVLWSQ